MSSQLSRQGAKIFTFGEFSLDTSRRQLLRQANPVSLTPKAFDTLVVLVRKYGQVVEKDELLKEIWPDTFVEEATLAQNVFTLRKALAQGPATTSYIETVPKHGYRFVADVREVSADTGELVLEKHTKTRIVSETFVQRQSRVSQLWDAMRDERAVLVTVALTITLALAGLLYLKLRSRNSASGLIPISQKMRVQKLTSNGKVIRAAISPVGKYVVYAMQEGELQGLWLRQVGATSNVQIAPNSPGQYNALAFAPDGNSIYYSRYEPEDDMGRLYQIPVLGGTPKPILSDIDSAISFSPDKKKLAFFRDNPIIRQYDLIVANVDGSAEHKLVTYYGLFLGEKPAWSPDGEIIVFPRRLGDPNRSKSVLMAVAVIDGQEKTIGTLEWAAIGEVAWLPDGTGLVIAATDESTGVFSPQIWEVSYPGGEAHRVTNDLNAYTGVSLTSGAEAVVTESDRVANLWLGTASDLNNSKQITSGMGDKGGEVLGLSWTKDKRIVYGSTASGGLDVWAIDTVGGNQKQLTVDPLADLKPSVSPTDGLIVFVSWRTGAPHLWIMDSDGGNPRQLTNGKSESFPSVSPDGKWVAYNTIDNGEVSLWKLPLKGGQPLRLTDRSGAFPNVSPDGKLIACFYRESNQSPLHIALIPSDGGRPVKLFDFPKNIFIDGGVRWMPDGLALTFITDKRGLSNIWKQPLDGSPPKPLTNFSSGQIFRFAWSPDGEQLVFERGITLRDVILISDFR